MRIVFGFVHRLPVNTTSVEQKYSKPINEAGGSKKQEQQISYVGYHIQIKIINHNA